MSKVYIFVRFCLLTLITDIDWVVEAPRMGQYYKNALLTIAAASSEDVRTSFLRSQGKGEVKEPLFQFESPDGIAYPVIGR